MLARQMELLPGGGTALALAGVKLGIGLAINFMLGALMTLGIGLYAPCMIMISLLGMRPDRGLPDHDGIVRVPDADWRPPVRAQGRLRPARRGRARDWRHPGVLIAAFIVKSLPLDAVRWLVVVVVVYTAAMLLRSAMTSAADEGWRQPRGPGSIAR